MRLQAIKLAGFKSFVDPTTVPFPSNLCAVVGPNGCGKSNIIDAVRWVMGESSAKTLRGESMADVIFNGSNTRMPIGQASIELLFDNSEGRLTGEYAAYNEISIKRQVTRDGQSNYFLNNQKCRRKDITDIFLGTGLGPRSYSIIEQGMISQLIEARPEDLRNYIEEAAGISKYKERRRETERRISHTQDNLDRLTDLREELERQLLHLERQAKAAEKYTEFKKEERTVRAQLQALRWQAISKEAESLENNIGRLENEQQARIADQRRVDANIETARDKLTALSDDLNEVQKRYYDHGTEIARIEDGIQFQNERAQQLRSDLDQVEGNIGKVREDLENDERLLRQFREEREELEPQRQSMMDAESVSGSRLAEFETALADWQRDWDAFNQAAAESRQQGEVEQSRIGHLDEAIERASTRLRTLAQDIERLSGLNIDAEIGPQEAMLETQQEQLSRIEEELNALTTRIENQRAENQSLGGQLDTKRGELQVLNGRHASLEALQQAALGQQDDAGVNWLAENGLADSARLAEKLKVAEGWEVAVETVLGDYLQSVLVEDLDNVARLSSSLSQGAMRFLSTGTVSAPAGDSASYLVDKVEAPADIAAFLGKVRTADSLDAAIALRGSLPSDESVITADGFWLGPNWLRVSREEDVTAGVIKRQAELDELETGRESLVAEIAGLEENLEGGVAALQLAEGERDQLQGRRADQQRAFGETRAKLGAMRVQADQVRNDLARAGEEQGKIQAQLEIDEASLRTARGALQQAMDRMESDNDKRESLGRKREEVQQQLETARQQARSDRDASHQLALRLQSLESQVASTQQAMQRLEEQRATLTDRKSSLETAITESVEPQDQLRQELESQLQQRLAVETELTELRQKTEALEHEIRSEEKARAGFEEQVEQVRASLEKVRIEYQGLEVRRSTIAEQLAEDEIKLEEVVAAMPREANEADWEDQLRRIENRIQRLGAINLAAIDEFKVASERKTYLDAQNEDLEKALTTLQNAIRKIDVETRTRFKETFDKVNAKLQQLFPRLFGGGHAYLEMTGEDLLDTGVGLMARPPGKRNSSIHLLSGGEKALTAIALVFSIFSLNPAPFCLLDEVDAPLDDANVQRYSDMVKEMSRTVQFIYITHNKVAMEMAEQLMGVTMHEAGVSRLVSVDVDEAVAMAAV